MSRAYISPEKPRAHASFRFLLGFCGFYGKERLEVLELVLQVVVSYMVCQLVVVAMQLGMGHSRTDNRSTRDGTEVLGLWPKLLRFLRFNPLRLPSRH